MNARHVSARTLSLSALALAITGAVLYAGPLDDAAKRARKQMVTAILLDVASKAGMGFETRGQLDEAFIDLDVRGLPVDQLPATLARPNFGVLMRRNLTSGVSRPVAVLLGTEATKVKK